MYMIREKSIYNRKYHIENLLNYVSEKQKIFVSVENKIKIHTIFKKSIKYFYRLIKIEKG